MKSHALKSKLEMLRILLSLYLKPKVRNDNLYSELNFKTMKYRLGYLKESFKSLEETCK